MNHIKHCQLSKNLGAEIDTSIWYIIPTVEVFIFSKGWMISVEFLCFSISFFKGD